MNDDVSWALRIAERICWDRGTPPVPGLHAVDRTGHAVVNTGRDAAIEIAAACLILSAAMKASR